MNLFPVIVVAESDAVARREIISQLAVVAPKAEIVCCEDGIQAWQLLTSRHADLLILNLRISQLPGFVLINKLATEGWSVPSILLTGEFDGFLRHVLQQAHMPFLHQPSTTESLSKLLHSVYHVDLWQHAGGLAMFLQAFETRLPWQDKVRWLKLQGSEGECIKHVDDVFYLRKDAKTKRIAIGTDHGEHWLLDAFFDLLIRLDPERFWRVNRHTVINALHVVASGHDYLGRQWLELRDGMRLKVGSAYERFDISAQLATRQQRLLS